MTVPLMNYNEKLTFKVEILKAPFFVDSQKMHACKRTFEFNCQNLLP